MWKMSFSIKKRKNFGCQVYLANCYNRSESSNTFLLSITPQNKVEHSENPFEIAIGLS